MADHKHPLAEVFGYLTTDQTPAAARYRKNRLCPFNNKVPNCTKDKAKNPLGVCSVYHNDNVIITCPIRFRQDWIIADHAAEFFFPPGAVWSSLTEVRLNDGLGKSAGNIDVVLVSYDEGGRISDFGALEIQAVYISGNVRAPFEHYMTDPNKNQNMDWSAEPNYPRPDYLSSSRKRLAPQLLFKGGILNSWKKKVAVALNRAFLSTLPDLKRVSKEKADMAWLVYDLKLGPGGFSLERVDTVYTEFQPALLKITQPIPGRLEDFVKILQEKLDERLETPPKNETIEKPF
ncbi:MAG: NotI family restriction endonuclease [Pseudomonadota bacterium]